MNTGLVEGPWPLQGEARTADAFEVWVLPCLPAMARLATRLAGPADRDDVVQESLARAWRRWETYRPERGSPQAWLLAIVADQARRSRRRRGGSQALDPGLAAPQRLPDIDLERAIRALPRRQRLAVELHYFVGLTTAEAAEVLACSEGTVKSNLHDARAHLRRSLEQE